MAGNLEVDSVIERLLSVRGQQNNRTVQLAEGEIRSLCAAARCDGDPACEPGDVMLSRSASSSGAVSQIWAPGVRKALVGGIVGPGCQEARGCAEGPLGPSTGSLGALGIAR